MKRLMFAMMFAAIGVAGTATAALAFEPPSDPAGKFSCPGGDPVAGHPGATGLAGVVNPDRLGPWNAVFAPNSPLTLCGD